MPGELDQRWKLVLVLGIAALAVSVAAWAFSIAQGQGIGPAIGAAIVGIVCVALAISQKPR